MDKKGSVMLWVRILIAVKTDENILIGFGFEPWLYFISDFESLCLPVINWFLVY